MEEPSSVMYVSAHSSFIKLSLENLFDEVLGGIVSNWVWWVGISTFERIKLNKSGVPFNVLFNLIVLGHFLILLCLAELVVGFLISGIDKDVNIDK
jgi:hypothetical protein